MLNKFKEVEFILKRASESLDWLRGNVRHPDPDLSPDKQWRILEESFDLYTTDVRFHMGEFASRLRNGLNYFTCILAEQDSGRVGKRVQFPIEDMPEGFAGHRDSYLEGITDEHVAAIEVYQPYKTGDWIKDLRALSNWYRHSGLIKAQKVFQEPKRFPSPPRAYRTPAGHVVEMQSGFFVAVSLEDGRPVVQTLEEIHRRICGATDNLKPTIQRYLSNFI
jgi:hypothetical protein